MDLKINTSAPRSKGSPQSQRYYASVFSLYCLGLSMKLGGLFAAWNNGLVVGFWEFMILTAFVAAGYGCLVLCMAELVSVIAFPGGFYGYARCCLGPFWGYLVGCSGLVESIFYLAVSLLKLGQAMTATFCISSRYEPIWWTIALVSMLLFYMDGGKSVWQLSSVCAVVGLVSLLIYLLGSIPAMDGSQYLDPEGEGGGFEGDVNHFFRFMRLPAWFFIGIDLLTLTSRDTHQPCHTIPKAMIAVWCTMMVLSFWLIVMVCGQAPGISVRLFGLNTIFPLSFGLSHSLHIPLSSATAFSLLPPVASSLSYLWLCSRQMHAMATSGLLPSVLRVTYGKHFSPIVSMVVISVFSVFALIMAWLFNPHTMLFRMSVMGGCGVYVSMFYCFLTFRWRYDQMEKFFTNPLGVASSVVGMIIFLTVLVSLIFFQPGVEVTVSYFSFLVGLSEKKVTPSAEPAVASLRSSSSHRAHSHDSFDYGFTSDLCARSHFVQEGQGNVPVDAVDDFHDDNVKDASFKSRIYDYDEGLEHFNIPSLSWDMLLYKGEHGGYPLGIFASRDSGDPHFLGNGHRILPMSSFSNKKFSVTVPYMDSLSGENQQIV
eukprot:gene5428-5967_t